jgi:predicted HTH domain antitoxin
MKTVEKRNKLKNLIFKVYGRGNVTTDEASEILEMEVGDFVTEFEDWQGPE